jgi:hypothetical protein
LINQGDALLEGRSINWWKLILTYLLPCAVSTDGAVSYRISAARSLADTARAMIGITSVAVPGAEFAPDEGCIAVRHRPRVRSRPFRGGMTHGP